MALTAVTVTQRGSSASSREDLSGFADFTPPHEWVAIVAYLRWKARGERHGGDKVDWYWAEAEIRNAVSFASRGKSSRDAHHWISTIKCLKPSEAVLRLCGAMGKSTRIAPIENSCQYVASGERQEAAQLLSQEACRMSTKVNITTNCEPMTLQEQRLFSVNYDFISAISPDDRRRLTDRYAVIGRANGERGTVLFDAATMDEALEFARHRENPTDYFVRYFPAEHRENDISSLTMPCRPS